MLASELVLPVMLQQRAAETPDAEFLIDVRGPRMTYGEFHALTLRWAGAFRRAGIGSGDMVATMLPNCLEAFAVWLGLSWLGAIEVPLNTAYRGAMLEHTLTNAGSRLALIGPAYAAQFAEVRDRCPALVDVVVDHDAFVAGAEPPTGLQTPAYYDTSCMIYTSGTTGPSKGVLVPWAELFQFVTTLPDDVLAPGEAYYLCLPVFHVSGKSGIYIAAHHRGRLVMRDTFSLTEFWPDIATHGVTATGILGVMASFLMSVPVQPGESETPLRSCSMGPLVADVDVFKQRFGVRVSTGYGMTEIGTPLASDGWSLANATSSGRVRTGYPGYEVRVGDEHDEQVGPGIVGELLVRAAEPWVLNAGYHNMPAATAAAWRNGWFHTGDAFRYDEDGNYYFVDRIKDAIRRRGENISSFEVEAYVARHPAVQEVAALAVPAQHGEDEVKICVVVRSGQELDPRDLIDFLVPDMPRFMIPRFVELVAELPKTPTHRVRKVDLREVGVTAQTWDRETAGVELPR